jgi:hypothetical protein
VVTTTDARRLAVRARALGRFWLIDFRGPQWAGGRRRLLMKHYRHYLTTPAIPPEYLPRRGSDDGRRAQVGFSGAFAARIDAVQRSAARRPQLVHLTYRPLGKNLRLLGTAVRDCTDRGRRVVVESGGPPTEQQALARRGLTWDPWLWSRSSEAAPEALHDAARAWNELFEHPRAAERSARNVAAPPLPRLRGRDLPFTPRYLRKVLKIAAATRYVFSPVSSAMASIEALRREMGWPDAPAPVLGMHVRRGDAAAAASDGSSPDRATRRSFSLHEYLDAADRICGEHDIRHIFLATESIEEIEAAQRLRPQYTFLWLPHDRSLFPDIRSSGTFIEDLALEHPEIAKPLALTAIQDLYFFCECDAFVGTFNSEFSILAWLLAVGGRGHVVPYTSLSRPASRRSLNPFDALLNVRNNVPLELYHW